MAHALYYPLLVVGATSMSILLGEYLAIHLERQNSRLEIALSFIKTYRRFWYGVLDAD